MNQLKLICQLCQEVIAKFDIEEVKFPIDGSMFKSPDKAHGIPDPFYPGADFEFMRCPYGGHRPMILPDKILTDKGLLNLSPDGNHYFTEYTTDSERSFILDREQLDRPIPMMSDEEAERRARIDERTENVETEAEPGKQADSEPIKEEEKEIPAGKHFCRECDKEFVNLAGYTNHMRIKHKTTEAVDNA